MGKSVNSVMDDLLLISSFFMHSPSQPSVQVWSLRSINTTENILGNRHVCAYRYGKKHDKHMFVFWGTDFGKNKKGVGVCVDVMCVCVFVDHTSTLGQPWILFLRSCLSTLFIQSWCFTEPGGHYPPTSTTHPILHPNPPRSALPLEVRDQTQIHSRHFSDWTTH